MPWSCPLPTTSGTKDDSLGTVNPENNVTATMVPPTSVPALAGIGAGAIHAAAVGAHADHRVAASIFVVLAALQLATGVAFLVRPGRAVAKAVVAVNAFAVAGWLLTRTVGVWLIPGLGLERPGFADTVCALLGVSAAVGAWRLLSADTRVGCDVAVASGDERPRAGGALGRRGVVGGAGDELGGH